MSRFISWAKSRPILTKLVPTLESELARNLQGCKTVLDLGCGPTSPLVTIDWLTRKVGVEPFSPYLMRAMENKTHHEFIQSMIADLKFGESEFDAVILIDVIEHMSKPDALKVLTMAEKWASKKVIVNSPNGFVPQRALDGNPLQEHLSGWDFREMKKLGFTSRGLAGPKVLRQEVDATTMESSLLSSIRLKPRAFWFFVAVLLQPFVYRCPRLAFSLMSVKAVGDNVKSI